MRVWRLGVALAWLVTAVLWAGKYNTIVEVGMKAPGFANLPGTDGKSYSLADFKEDVVVLVFLANHCPWVRGGDWDLINLVKEFKGKSVRVVGLLRLPTKRLPQSVWFPRAKGNRKALKLALGAVTQDRDERDASILGR